MAWCLAKALKIAPVIKQRRVIAVWPDVIGHQLARVGFRLPAHGACEACRK